MSEFNFHLKKHFSHFFHLLKRQSEIIKHLSLFLSKCRRFHSISLEKSSAHSFTDTSRLPARVFQSIFHSTRLWFQITRIQCITLDNFPPKITRKLNIFYIEIHFRWTKIFISTLAQFHWTMTFVWHEICCSVLHVTWSCSSSEACNA